MNGKFDTFSDVQKKKEEMFCLKVVQVEKFVIENAEDINNKRKKKLSRKQATPDIVSKMHICFDRLAVIASSSSSAGILIIRRSDQTTFLCKMKMC